MTRGNLLTLLLAGNVCVGLAAMPALMAQASSAQAQESQQPAGTAQRVSKLGTLKSIAGQKLVLKADSGADVNVTIQEGVRILRMAPGQTDLKSATPIALLEIQVGDRMLVSGKPGDGTDSVLASRIIVMKQADVTQKQQQEMQDWQKRGTGGIVTAIDAASGTVTVDVNPTLKIAVKTTKDTVFRRYAPNSIKFSEALKGSFDLIQAGDQLRARGARSADGKELAAEEVISGTFRNIAGTITAIDTANSTVTVKDILGKKTVTVKLTGDSQMRKLPAQMAQQIAFFLKAPQAAQAAAAGAGGANGSATSSGGTSGAGGANGSGPGGARRAPQDFGQMVNRLPAVTLTDLQKDEVVMIVSTMGSGNSEVTAITLLSGVEPILTAAPNAAQLLSGWNLSAPGGDAGSQ